MDLSIIIVNWKVKHLLEKCLKSIFWHLENINREVIVVDNGSGDGSAEMVREQFPEVQLLASKHNLGFARANNLGIKKARGRYILLLNPDTELCDDSIIKLVGLAEKNSDWGIIGPKILNPDKSLQLSVRRFPKLLDQALILLKLHHVWPFRKVLNKYLAVDFNYKKNASVDQIMGACFLMSRKLIEKIGLLDERFFYWFEEVDYCRRARSAGFKVIYTPEAEIIHYGGASFDQLDWRRQLVWNRSLQIYFWKHKEKWQVFILWLLQPFSVLLAILAWLWRK